MDDEIQMSMSLPLDSDGFLRRHCPTCEREFKRFAGSDEDDVDEAPDGGYFCPYCALQAPPDAWHTPAQLELARTLVLREVLPQMKQRLDRSIRDLERGSGEFVGGSVDIDLSDEPDELAETDDMRRVDFTCHPDDGVKVLDDWDRSVHCPECGQPA